jgi:hypothetical protein
VLVVESLERLGVPLLGSLDELGFVRVVALIFFSISIFALWLSLF